MPKNSVQEWDTTASNNTDVGGIGIQGTNAVSNFDNGLRTVMSQLATYTRAQSQTVATRTALKAFDTTKFTIALLTEAGREGVFKWTAGDYSTQIAADTQEGVYVKADAIASTAGAWVRVGWEKGIVLTWFGAQRGYANDSRNAILAAISFSQTFEVAIRDKGVYGVVGNIEITGSPVTIEGDGRPARIWFDTTDDGDNLRPGFKDEIPGLVFIFKNGGTPTSVTISDRSDDYSSITPMLSLAAHGNRLRRLAIVQDMDIFDAVGDYNDIAEVAASIADDFDVGLLINDTRRNVIEDVTVFGYLDKAGTCVYSKDGDDDPDYNRWINGTTYGRHGAALISANAAPASRGLSGTTFIGTLFCANDSKARVATDTATAHYSGAADWRCLYIDGDTDGTTAEINGHYFTNCVFRTASDHALELDHASNAVFSGCIFEHNYYSVTNSTDTPTFIASANTKKGVQFVGCRINYSTMIFHADFVGALAAGIGVFVQGDPIQSRAAWVYSNPDIVGGYAATVVGGDGGVGDPSVQFTKDINSGSSGWKILMDISGSDVLQARYGGTTMISASTSGLVASRAHADQQGSALTIAGGIIAVTHGFHAINGEGSAADDLVTINGALATGQRLTLRRGNADITIKHGTGNIRCGADRVLNSSLDRIELEWDGTFWVMVSYADNA